MTFIIAKLSLRGGLLLAAGLALSGCMGPTYGTGRSAGEQLLADLDGMTSLGSSGSGGERIAYAPRPELVTPENRGVLPPPRPPVNAAGDPSWPESPEIRSARIRAAAYSSGDSDTPIPAGVMTAAKEGVSDEQLSRASRGNGVLRSDHDDNVLSPQELRSSGELARQRIAQRNQGSSNQRRYLSEPPVAYRQPAATAPVGDPGIDEAVKQARTGETESIGSKIRDILPF